MSVQSSRTYPLPDPTSLAARIKSLNGPAIDPSQPTGEAKVHGCDLTWVIAGGQITVTVVSKPMFATYGMVFGKLDELFGGA